MILFSFQEFITHKVRWDFVDCHLHLSKRKFRVSVVFDIATIKSPSRIFNLIGYCERKRQKFFVLFTFLRYTYKIIQYLNNIRAE